MLRIDWQAVESDTLDALPSLVDPRRINVDSAADLEDWCASMLQTERVRLFDETYRRLNGQLRVLKLITDKTTVVVQPDVARRDVVLGKRAALGSNLGNLRHDPRNNDHESRSRAACGQELASKAESVASRGRQLSYASEAGRYRSCTFITDCRIVINGQPDTGSGRNNLSQGVIAQDLAPLIDELTSATTKHSKAQQLNRKRQGAMLEECLQHKKQHPSAGRHLVGKERPASSESEQEKSARAHKLREQAVTAQNPLLKSKIHQKADKGIACTTKPVGKCVGVWPDVKPALAKDKSQESSSSALSDSDDSSLPIHKAEPKKSVLPKHEKKVQDPPREICAKKPVKYQQDSDSSESDDEADEEAVKPARRQQYMGIMDTLKAAENSQGHKMTHFIKGATQQSLEASQTQPLANKAKVSGRPGTMAADDQSSSDEDSSDKIVSKVGDTQLLRTTQNFGNAQRQATAATKPHLNAQRSNIAHPGTGYVQHIAQNEQHETDNSNEYNKPSNSIKGVNAPKQSGSQSAAWGRGEAKPSHQKIDLDLTKLEVNSRKQAKEGFVEIDSSAMLAVSELDLGVLFFPGIIISYKQLTIDEDMNVVVDSEPTESKVVCQAGKMLLVVDFQGNEDEVMLDSFYELTLDCRPMDTRQLGVLDKVRKGGPIGLGATQEPAQPPYHHHEQIPIEALAAPSSEEQTKNIHTVQQKNNDAIGSTHDSDDDDKGPSLAGQRELAQMQEHKNKYRQMASVDSEMSQREREISHQVSYYFGDKNYFGDRFIQNHVAHDPDNGMLL